MTGMTVDDKMTTKKDLDHYFRETPGVFISGETWKHLGDEKF